MATEVLCNRENCKNQTGKQTCGATQIGIVDGQCITRRRMKRADNYRDLMKADSVPIYRRESPNSAKITGRMK